MTKRTLWHQSIAQQWKIYKPPVRPSVGEVALLRRRMTKKHARTLILGGTPELRDLVRSLGHEVTLVDASFPMVEAMTTLMKHPNPRETWVRSNWLTAPLAENYFDYVLGDFVINNLPTKLQERFISNIARWLRPGGLFLTRHYLVSRDYTPEYVMDRFRRSDRNAFNFAMLATGYDRHRGDLKTARAADRFRRAFPRERALLADFRRFFPPGKTWYPTPETILLSILRRHFTLRARLPGAGHAFTAETPTYVFQKI